MDILNLLVIQPTYCTFLINRQLRAFTDPAIVLFMAMLFIIVIHVVYTLGGGYRGRDHMVVGFTTTYAINAYQFHQYQQNEQSLILTELIEHKKTTTLH